MLNLTWHKISTAHQKITAHGETNVSDVEVIKRKLQNFSCSVYFTTLTNCGFKFNGGIIIPPRQEISNNVAF